MVQFVMTSWSKPCSSCVSILPETENPKNERRTLAMVVLHTEHINEIGYYHQFANDMRVINVLLVCSIDARMIQIEFKNRDVLCETYNAFGSLRMHGFDRVSLCECPGIDWDKSWSLKTPLTLILVSHFFVIFLTFVLPLPMLANPYFVCFSLLMYYSVH